MGSINDNTYRRKRTRNNLVRKPLPSHRAILCYALTQIVLSPVEGFAFQPQLHPISTSIRHAYGSFQTSLNYSDADNQNSHPNQYRRKGNKTKNQIKVDLQHQLHALEQMNHEQHHNGASVKNPAIFSDFNSNVYNSIWASRSVTDVQEVLIQFVNTAKNIIHQVSGTSAPVSQQSFQAEIQLIGPNIAAAALRRIIDLRPDVNGRSGSGSGSGSGSEVDARLAREMIPSLLQIVAREVVHAESVQVPTHFNTSELYSFSNFVLAMRKLMGPSGTVIDTGLSAVSNANALHSLAKIKLLQKKSGKFNDDTTLKPLVRKICINIRGCEGNDDDLNFVNRVNPVLLTEMLCVLATFGMKDEVNLLTLIGDRLKQGDATGKLNCKQLSLGLWAYASLERPHLGVLKSFSRRIRKVNVRQELTSVDISRAIWAAGKSMKQLDLMVQNGSQMNVDGKSGLFSDEEIASLRQDAVTMLYTVTAELMQPKHANNPDVKKLNGLGVNQIADLLGTYVIFEFDPSHAIFDELSVHIRNRIEGERNVSATDIARILWSFQRLRVAPDQDTLTTLVEKFVHFAESKQAKAIPPKILNTVLRSVAMLLPDHGKRIPELHIATSALLSDHGYLLKCNEFECSNFMWSLAMANRYDKPLIELLSDRMREEDIVKSLTPSSASRFLWSFTKLVEGNKVDLEMKEVLFEMFQSLGGILLSRQLTPVDSSSSMWAMAKSSYSLDMGIFDHLAEVLAADFMLERATLQQITEALWACGKMISFEDPLRERMEFGEVTPPPYVKNAVKFATFLALKCDKMSTKDLSQALWAIGRLQISNPSIVAPLVYKAEEIARTERFNSQELANVLWALSKVDFDDEDCVSSFTKQIRRPSILSSTTSQEAANVLYALGKMQIRDEETFSCMNSVLMRKLEDATTQTIANALWAHESVNLVAPGQLFDSWAREKLDIVGLYSDYHQIEIIERSNTENSD